MQFNTGDIVKLISRSTNQLIPIGTKGKVIEFHWTGSIGIEWKIPINGHSCGEIGKNGYCWYVGVETLALVEKGYTPTKQELVENKCKKLWNNSSWVKKNPIYAY